MNVPANLKHYWRYRMPMTLETLLAADTFHAKFKEMVTQSGR